MRSIASTNISSFCLFDPFHVPQLFDSAEVDAIVKEIEAEKEVEAEKKKTAKKPASSE